MKVLDASAILHGDLDFREGGFLVTNSVLSEVREDKAKVMLDQAMREGLIEVRDPSGGCLGEARAAAMATGDISRLSQTDVDVLALALDSGAEIVSDDYGIQNVAKRLDLKIMKTAQEGIRNELVWEKKCPGCGKRYDHNASECGVCGLPLKSVGKKVRRR